ncbi:MAG: FliA/WhiG family RNA polymerase sigma factor [Ignavibacteria bacterium]|nr:FliA/WhiG family RNA polymerase sigma factor [Ignavibacteria bacterium]
MEDIWYDYKKSKSPELRNKIVLKYIPLVKNILKGINVPPNSLLSNDDLISIGIIGLVEAIEKFEPSQNVKFETYAYPRIKGAVLDELRKVDWLSRNTRRKAKEFIETLDKSFVHTGNYNINEITKSLNLDEKELRNYILAFQSSQESFFVGETIEILDDGEELSYFENLPSYEEGNQLESIVNNEKVQVIYQFLLSLPERERLIVTLYYYENLKFKEIGKILGLSESRVSQIHSSVIRRLRKKFKELEE